MTPNHDPVTTCIITCKWAFKCWIAVFFCSRINSSSHKGWHAPCSMQSDFSFLSNHPFSNLPLGLTIKSCMWYSRRNESLESLPPMNLHKAICHSYGHRLAVLQCDKWISTPWPVNAGRQLERLSKCGTQSLLICDMQLFIWILQCHAMTCYALSVQSSSLWVESSN